MTPTVLAGSRVMRGVRTPGASDIVDRAWWAEDGTDVVAALGSDATSGLSDDEVKRRRDRFGTNALDVHPPVSRLEVLARQFRSIIVALLVAAIVVALAFGELPEAIAIAVVIVLNAAIGFVTELRAQRSMEALLRLGSHAARVVRNGSAIVVRSEDLVPGDIVVVEAGEIVAADLRLLQSSRLECDESVITGESLPLAKDPKPVPANAAVHERSAMLFKGTSVARGSGSGVVTATGQDTELGRIAHLARWARPEATPLEKRLDNLGRRLVGLTIVIGIVIAVVGVLGDKDVYLMVQTAVALAVATIPEGLPIVATIALAAGVRRMAKRNVLINRLAAVETLGSTHVICTDKTGTLTENRMTVAEVATSRGQTVAADFVVGSEHADADTQDPNVILATVTALCNNATSGATADGSEPMETALLRWLDECGISAADIRERYPRIFEEAFDPEIKMMATVHGAGDQSSSRDPEDTASDGGAPSDTVYPHDADGPSATSRHEGEIRIVAVKGAPEAVIAASDTILTDSAAADFTDAARAEWLERAGQMGAAGQRVLAMAWRRSDDGRVDDPYGHLQFVGLVGLNDPPRNDVRAALADCEAAGIQVVMVTGDQPGTALSVARAIGIERDGRGEVVRGDEIREASTEAGGVVSGRPIVELEAERGAIISNGGTVDVPPTGAGPRPNLLDARIFARVSPRQKLDLIALHQQAGRVVAMTGDGVNDAPALKKADIGVAMGVRGTEVAKEAAAVVLLDDAFSSIVVAVREGRIIFENIRTFVVYLMSCNLSEVLVVGVSTLAGGPLPILPLQILFLNLVTDVFPALALGVSRGRPDILKEKPRPRSTPILRRREWLMIGGLGMVLTVAVLASLFVALTVFGMPRGEAVTVSFLTLVFSQLVNVFNMRGARSNVVVNEVTANRYVWMALALCVAITVVVLEVPSLARALSLFEPGVAGWGIVSVGAAFTLLFGQLWVIVLGRHPALPHETEAAT